MGEWVPIEHWASCKDMQRPGIVFEIRNDEGLSLFTPCVLPLPQMPFDWVLPPTKFRAVAEAAPRRSPPLPPPAATK